MDKGIYRGKRKDNGEWIYGYLTVCDERYFIVEEGKVECLCFDTLPKGHYVFMQYIEIIPETLGRLLRHVDYDGSYECDRLFQNDIIAIWGRHQDINTTEPYTTALVLDEHTVSENGYGRWFPQDTTRIRVIGNAYDNPELLKGYEMNRFINGMHECPNDYSERHRRIMKEYAIHGAHAYCYICNFENEYICRQYNGGCSRLGDCQRIHVSESAKNSHAGDGERK